MFSHLRAPSGDASCRDHKAWGKCNDGFMTSPSHPSAKALGSYCGVTCGRCQEGEFACADRAVPGGLSGGQGIGREGVSKAMLQGLGKEGMSKALLLGAKALLLDTNRLVCGPCGARLPI